MNITEQRTATFQRLRGRQDDLMRAIRAVSIEIDRIEVVQRVAERLIAPGQALEASARDFVADVQEHTRTLKARVEAMRDELARVSTQIFELQEHVERVEPTLPSSPLLARYTNEEIDEWLARR